MNPWPPLLCLLFAIGAGAGGYIKGRADNEAKHIAINAAAVLVELKQAAIDAKAQRETADALKAQTTRNETLLRDYEDAVGNNSVPDTNGSSRDSLQRLKNFAIAAEAAAGQ